MRRLVMPLAVLLVGSVAARAEDYVTEKGHLICTTLQSLRDAKEAYDKHDRGWFESIKECSQSIGGLKVEVLQDGPLTSKVKIYEEDGKATVYWTSPTTLKEVRR
jgi:hypothetical protein